jgi:hypothetical protein
MDSLKDRSLLSKNNRKAAATESCGTTGIEGKKKGQLRISKQC